MANYYYEISDAVLHNYGGKYHVAHTRGGHDAMMAGGFAITRSSERIWRQDNDGSVKFVKHRYINILEDIPVDEKEFAWIKLQARTLA